MLPPIATSVATTDQNASSHMTTRRVPSYRVLVLSMLRVWPPEVIASMTSEVMPHRRPGRTDSRSRITDG